VIERMNTFARSLDLPGGMQILRPLQDVVPLPAWAHGRWARRLELALTGAILVVAVVQLALLVPFMIQVDSAGFDRGVYMTAAQRWLDGGGFYLPRQLGGAYHILGGDVLYPPTSLLLFVPFSFLPAFLWWAVPIGIVGYAVWQLRPAPWTWPILAFCVWWPRDQGLVVAGNPSMWTAAAVAGAVMYAWPGVLVLLKPSLFPFALVGIRHRSWWLAAALLVAVSIPFLGMWGDYAAALRDSDGDLMYSLGHLPLLLIPIVAWLGRTRDRLAPAPSAHA
jgi:hypothetical protein